jgi:hypothetical protein
MKAALITLFAAGALFSSNGEALFEKNCISCHEKILSKKQTEERWDRLKAPPMNEIIDRMRRMVNITGNDTDIQRHILILFMTDYLENPDVLIGLCDPVAFDQFGTMPSFKNKLTKKEMQEVSEWVYDRFEEVGFK